MKPTCLPFCSLVLWLVLLPASAGDLTGRVVLEGNPPPETRIDLTRFPALARSHPSGLLTRRYQVGADGGLQGVLVYLKGEFAQVAPAPKPVVLDHQEGWFAPQVMGVQIGQDFLLKYPQGTAIQADSRGQNGFKLAFKDSFKFREPEVGIRLRCECHPFNTAYVGVFAHPFFAVTDKDGNYRIAGAPSGRFSIEAWHPKAGVITTEVSVKDSLLRVSDMVLKAK